MFFKTWPRDSRMLFSRSGYQLKKYSIYLRYSILLYTSFRQLIFCLLSSVSVVLILDANFFHVLKLFQLTVMPNFSLHNLIESLAQQYKKRTNGRQRLSKQFPCQTFFHFMSSCTPCCQDFTFSQNITPYSSVD